MKVTKITIIRSVRNFFGQRQDFEDVRDWEVRREHVLKAVNHLLRNGDSYVHIDLDGGTSKGGEHWCLFQEWEHRGTDTLDVYKWTAIPTYDGRYNTAKDTLEITGKAFKRTSIDWTEE